MQHIRIIKIGFLFMLLTLLSACSSTIKQVSLDLVTQKYIDRGVAFMQVNRFDLAEASFRVAIENQQVPESYDGLACVYLAQGKFREASEMFDKILQWFPYYTDVYWHIAYLEEQQVESNRFYKLAVESDANNYKSKNNYALFLKDRVKNDSTDNFSEKLAKSYLEDASVITGRQHPLEKEL
jgi:Tfp pilus assembly protein PilF